MRHNLEHLPLVFDSGVFYRDCAGITIGGLKVFERHRMRFRPRNGKYAHWWRCECECGNVCFLTAERFSHVIYPSCGCKDTSRKPVCPAMRAIIIDHRVNTDKSTREIGAYFGVTKNAVVGILDRAGMCEQKPVKREPITFPPRSQCVWAFGDPGEPGFHWCCDPVKAESSYCPTHHGVVYITEKEAQRRKQAALSSINAVDLSQQRIRTLTSDKTTSPDETEAEAEGEPEIADAA